MRAGRLRFRIMMMQATESKNSVGEVLQTWNYVGSVWADIEPIRGEERLNIAQAQAVADTKITTRAKATRQVTPKMRFRYQDDEYDIDAMINWRERGIFREFYCKRVA